MTRQLKQNSIAQLEKLFLTNSKNLDMLAAMKVELNSRKTRRAEALSEKIEIVFEGAAAKLCPARGSHALPPPCQLEAAHPIVLKQKMTRTIDSAQGQTGLPKPIFPRISEEVRCPAAIDPVLNAVGNDTAIEDSITHLNVSEAYKALDAGPGSTWASIEHRRRAIVQQAHPANLAELSSDDKSKILAEAEKANLAYAFLHRQRTGSR